MNDPGRQGLIRVVQHDGRAVVTSAPAKAFITVELLAEIALGRSRDADVDDRGLFMGIQGLACGRVHYSVGTYDELRRGFPLQRIS